MELNDLKFLAAASLLAGSVKLDDPIIPGGTRRLRGPTETEIITAVRVVDSIWKEVLRQDGKSA